MKSVVTWHATSDPPEAPCRILVVYENKTYAAFYERGVVTRFGDNLVGLLLRNCDFWAEYPKPPKVTE